MDGFFFFEREAKIKNVLLFFIFISVHQKYTEFNRLLFPFTRIN